MGLLNFFKKNPKANSVFEPIAEAAVQENKTVKQYMKENHVNSLNEPLDELVNGELPWGWIAHNKDFTDEIEKEYSSFLQSWVSSRSRSPKESYSALSSFIEYIENVEMLCKSKGECFEFWFKEILTNEGYLEQRKEELFTLSANLSELQKIYEQKQILLSGIDADLYNLLSSNTGILQKDLYKHFDSSIKSEIQSLLYEWDKSGKIRREKFGNTYKLFIQ